MNLETITLTEAVRLLKKKEISTKNLIEHYVRKINQDNEREDKINAVVYLDAEKAIALLKQANKDNQDSLLAGAPLFLKNNMHLQGFPVECASKILSGYVSPYTGGLAKRLLDNGGTVMGLANMDEFAMGSSNEYSKYGLVRNPINRDYISGGSSGGSAALVAGGMGLAAFGSDTGGSIRLPAACCGIVGLKPTYGRVSRYGLVAFASSFDQIGPLTQNIEDAALLLQATAGYDAKDSTSSSRAVPDYLSALKKNIKGKKIAIPKEYFIQSNNSTGLDNEVRESIEKVKDFYQQAGCSLEEVSLPTTEYAISVYYILANAEASSNLSRFDGIRYGVRGEADDLNGVYEESREQGFGIEVKRRILIGAHVLSSGYYDAYYLKAQKVRNLIQKEYLKVLSEYDAILTPVMPTKVFKIGEKVEDPISMYLSDVFTVSVNVIGAPAISLPCGKDSQGLPIGFQLIGSLFDEENILNLAQVYQKENPIKFQVS